MSASRRRHHPSDRSALFVRIPREQAEALDRAAFEQRIPKQELVADLLTRYIDGAAEPELVVGHHSFRPDDSEVLTLEQAAGLLEVEPEVVAQLAEDGELPGRKLGGAWRFARQAVIGWLAHDARPSV